MQQERMRKGKRRREAKRQAYHSRLIVWWLYIRGGEEIQCTEYR
jgi:hypothetical protein